jgi:hypothetical protein
MKHPTQVVITLVTALFVALMSACVPTSNEIGEVPTPLSLSEQVPSTLTFADVVTPTLAVSPTVTQEPNPTVLASPALQDIIGFWKCADSGGGPASFDFTSSGQVFIKRVQAAYGAQYELLSENSILLEANATQEILKMVDFQRDTWSFEMAGTVLQCTRGTANINFQQSIVGLWVPVDTSRQLTDELFVIEFTEGNEILGFGWFGLGSEQVGYQIVSDNTIVVEAEHIDELMIRYAGGPPMLLIAQMTDDNLLLEWPFFEEPVSYTRIRGDIDLSKVIVGLWTTDSGADIEFTQQGKFIDHHNFFPSGTLVGSYETLSEQTVRLTLGEQSAEFNVFSVASNELMLMPFGNIDASGQPLVTDGPEGGLKLTRK